jgi:hypothetical protein
MEAVCSSKTSVDFQQAIQRYIPEVLFITTTVRTSNPTYARICFRVGYCSAIFGLSSLVGVMTQTDGRVYRILPVSRCSVTKLTITHSRKKSVHINKDVFFLLCTKTPISETKEVAYRSLH